MKPRLYLETTIPSYLVSKPSCDLIWHDPVVEEVRRIREQQAAEVNYDLDAIFERARRRQRQSKRKTVSFAGAATSDNRQEKRAALPRPVA